MNYTVPAKRKVERELRANGNWAGEEGVGRKEVNKNVTSNPHILVQRLRALM